MSYFVSSSSAGGQGNGLGWCLSSVLVAGTSRSWLLFRILLRMNRVLAPRKQRPATSPRPILKPSTVLFLCSDDFGDTDGSGEELDPNETRDVLIITALES